MNGWFLLMGMFGAGICYLIGHRSGYIQADRKYRLLQEKENAKMDEILRRYADFGRDELLEQLRRRTR